MCKRNFIGKTLLGLMILAIGALAAPVQAGAGVLFYSPSSLSVTVPAGSSGQLNYTISLEPANWRTNYMWTIDSVDGYDGLQAGWLSASPQTAFLSQWRPQSNITLVISVPAGTPSGTYAGIVYAKARASHGAADPGAGIDIVVTVPPVCNEVPAVTTTSYSPDEIFPANGALWDINVNGSITIPEGCTLLSAGYVLDDEYDVYDTVGAFIVNPDLTFTFTETVEARRNPDDPEGRSYTIIVFAENEAGIGQSARIVIMVPRNMAPPGLQNLPAGASVTIR